MNRKSKTLFLNYPRRNTSLSSKLEIFINNKVLPKAYKVKDAFVVFLDSKLNYYAWKDKAKLWLIDVFFTTVLVSSSLYFMGFDKPIRLGLGIVLAFEYAMNLITEVKYKIQDGN